MDVFLISVGAVALAEIGDKTQLLALVLAARYRAPIPIILGILVATTANHLAAAWVGVLAADFLSGDVLRWVIAASFIGMALWMLIPDKLDSGPRIGDKWGAFAATAISFFIVEIGDKTQIATVALAARYHAVLLVGAGTTVGLMLANVPVILAGKMVGNRLPLRLIHTISAVIFLVLGVAALIL